MKKVTFSLMAILAVASLSMPAFAANPNQNSMLIDTSGIAAFSTGNESLYPANMQQDVLQNPMLVDTSGIAFTMSNQSSDEHYGIAPAWGGPEGDSSGLKIENYPAYVLPGIYDNTN